MKTGRLRLDPGKSKLYLHQHKYANLVLSLAQCQTRKNAAWEPAFGINNYNIPLLNKQPDRWKGPTTINLHSYLCCTQPPPLKTSRSNPCSCMRAPSAPAQHAAQLHSPCHAAPHDSVVARTTSARCTRTPHQSESAITWGTPFQPHGQRHFGSAGIRNANQGLPCEHQRSPMLTGWHCVLSPVAQRDPHICTTHKPKLTTAVQDASTRQ